MRDPVIPAKAGIQDYLNDKVLLVGTPAALAESFGHLEPNTTRAVDGLGLLVWLRPEQWLLCLDAAGAGDGLARPGIDVLEAGARFVEFDVSGPHAAARLATGCSLDLRERAFPPGRCHQSRFEQVPVILHREALDRFTVFVERPLARYLARWLEEAR